MRSRWSWSWVFAILVVVLSTVAIASCGANSSRGRGDAPVGQQDKAPARVINMPDHYPNVAFKCLGTTGIYVSSHDKNDTQPTVVPRDPACGTG